MMMIDAYSMNCNGVENFKVLLLPVTAAADSRKEVAG
jgi:hypothetical protein